MGVAENVLWACSWSSERSSWSRWKGVISRPSILARRKRAGEAMAKPGELMACARLSKAAGVVTPPDEDEEAAEGKAVKGGGGHPSPARDKVGECG